MLSNSERYSRGDRNNVPETEVEKVEMTSVMEYAQQIAEAISAIVKIDVEIADNKLTRLAGTGMFRNGIGSSMQQQGSIYREVLSKGRQLVIDNPGEHYLCQQCKAKVTCCEKYEIISPIDVHGQIVGVIGLICCNETQVAIIETNLESYLAFLSKMAETIALKVMEQELVDGLVDANHYLTSVMNCLNEAIFTADMEGYLLHANLSAQNLFAGIPVMPKTHLSAILGGEIATEILNSARTGEELTEREIKVGVKHNRLRVVVHAMPIYAQDVMSGIVITVRPLAEISRMVNRLAMQEDSFYLVSDILGDSRSMRELREQAKTVAASKSTILIRGESGTGKGVLARAIHNLSPRRMGPFVAINCTAIPEGLLESELFGYEDGAFTGARKGGKIGKFELANQGTLFLDEIGDMPLFLQAKMLRVLQERQVERIGALNPIPVDVRVIAATHRDLEKMMAQHEFREDFYYRINVIPVFIASLRERKEDVDILCHHFIKGYNQQLNKHVVDMSESFRQKVYSYDWPGNVRELQNAIEYVMNLTEGPVLDAEYLPQKIREANLTAAVSLYSLAAIERDTIMRCLAEFGETVQGKSKAAAALGIGLATLYRKLSRYGLSQNGDNHLSK